MDFKLNKKISRIILVVLAIITILSWTAVFASSNNKLHIYFYDIGQGDGIYIRTPAGQDIIIDGGPDATILGKLGEDMPFYDREIELMIPTHPDADHITGLVDVLERYEVKMVLWNGAEKETAVFKELKNIIEEKNVPTKIARAGQKIIAGDAVFYIIHSKMKDRDMNDTSIVAQLVYGQNSVLLTGDAGKPVENDLIKDGVNLRSNILKVGHHGSKTCTSKTFLEAVDPEYAILSVGAKNSYGHPAKEVLDRLKDKKIFRTDLDGDVECVLDGKEMSCQGSRRVD